MAKTLAPLLSLDARGRIGGALIYSKQQGTTYTKAYAVPTNPQTAQQQAHRRCVAWATQQWTTLSATHKNAWRELADSLHLAPYHAFIKRAIPAVHELTAPERTPDDGQPTLWTPVSLQIFLTEYPDHYTLTTQHLTASGLLWAAFICANPTDPTAPNLASLLAFTEPPTIIGPFHRSDTTLPFPAGTISAASIRMFSNAHNQTIWHDISP